MVFRKLAESPKKLILICLTSTKYPLLVFLIGYLKGPWELRRGAILAREKLIKEFGILNKLVCSRKS